MTALHYQNVPERIAQLKAHLKTRRGRKDRQALQRLAELCRWMENRTTAVGVEHLLRCYYNLETDSPMWREHPFFAMLRKATADENVPDNRLYVTPVNIFPERPPMSHLVDDDPPIKTGASTQAYRDNFDRIFGVQEDRVADSGINVVAGPGVDEVRVERRSLVRDEECSTCGAKNGAPCDDEIHETTGQPRER